MFRYAIHYEEHLEEAVCRRQSDSESSRRAVPFDIRGMVDALA